MAPREKLKPTQLREYAYALKALKEQEVAELAELHARDPARLFKRVRESTRTVASYPAIDEPFYEARRKALPAPARSSDEIRSTQMFAAHLDGAKRVAVAGSSALSFRMVDREISPLRSLQVTAAPRHLDLLVTNAADHTLGVAELKIRNDIDSYRALIQALMYVVELSTKNQFARVHKYIDAVKQPNPALASDVYLIAFEPRSRARFRGRIDVATQVIAEALVNMPAEESHLRRIAYLDASLDEGAMKFTARYAFGAGM